MNAYENYEIDEVENINEESVSEEERKSFKITDLEKANWALRKISALNKGIAEIQGLAKYEHIRIDFWLDNTVESKKKSILFFEGLLKDYFKEERAKDKKFKISTPYGSVTSKKQQPVWECDGTAIQALEELGLSELIEIKKSIKKSEIKKALKAVNGKAVTEDGEIVEGITIVEQEEKITIKTNKL